MTTKYYPQLDANPNFAALEEGILAFWKEQRIFEKSVDARAEKKADGASNAYVFYDGPPFANGLPHYGHLLTGYVKDAIARYHTMRGSRVERRFGWDCHGLPAEMGAEKELGISGRAAIAGYGIDKFNEYCRTSVMKYTQEWEYYVTRQGRWVDFKNDYKTMDKNFMESCLWAFKELYTKGLIYESMRVMPYSWAAETPVSNFETRIDNATREREDKAAYVKFRLKEKPKGAPDAKNYYVIAWTTTPWTLPSNLALAVSRDVCYMNFVHNNNCYIVSAKALPSLQALFNSKEEFVEAIDAQKKYSDEERFITCDSEVEQESQVAKRLIGLTYEPLFPYFADTPNAFRILDGSEFVTDGDGTGIVHIAPGFGEVDQKCCNENGIETLVPVDEKGRFTDAIYDLPPTKSPKSDLTPPQGGSSSVAALQDNNREGFSAAAAGQMRDASSSPLEGEPNSPANLVGGLKLAGLTVVPDTRIAEADIVVSEEDKAQHIAAKDIAKYGLANMRIVRWLKANGSLVKDEPIKHNYPHCWRTDTPLIYRAMSSWYVAINTQVEALGGRSVKEVMAANNLGIHWIPDHVQAGQMGKGIESAPDWSISRNRFWGTPIPIWKSASGKIHVCGSIEEIEKLSGVKVTDLHRPYIDKVVLKIDGEEYTRIEDVFDCWFESGSMPFAQVHYPFENKYRFEESFPADFITEYIAQTRGWFYTLQVLSAALFACAPFKNCICHGVVIDEETGLKYSKRLKNYRDPKEVMDQYGADALRWMMLASPVMRGSDLGVDPDGKFIRDVVRLNIKPLWSAFNFFTLYANADGVKASPRLYDGVSRNRGEPASGDPVIRRDDNMLDRYILAKAKAAVTQVRASMDAYDTPGATEAITAFLDVLNNWYIRRSRPRFWGEEMTADKQAAYDTLFTVLDLMCRAAAPLLPFVSEAVYRGLHGAPPTETRRGVSTPPQGGSYAVAALQDNNRAGVSVAAVGQMRDASSSPLEGEPNSPANLVGGNISVHLTDFPDVSAIADEAELIADMDWVRDVCNAGSAVRNKQNIRNRQPLASLVVYGANPMLLRYWGSNDEKDNRVWYDMKQIIEEELNVKTVESISDSGALEKAADKRLQINSQKLGKKYPEKMKQILPASKKGEWSFAKGVIGVDIAGVTLEPEYYTISLDPKPAFKDSSAPLSTNDALVVLDLTITPELEAEGQARDLVRMIQQARKDAGLHVADRITLAVDVPENFKAALKLHGEYIAAQTLAVSIGEGSAQAAQQVTQELDGEQFVIGLSKVA